MGSCVSSHKEESDSAMRFRCSIGSIAKKLFVSSPTKEKPQNGGKPVDGFDFKSKPGDAVFGFRSPDLGSKEEAFFDSQAWLDSDCEDDFLSVNGEFTPSRGSTPNHQTSVPVTPRLNKAFLVDGFPDSKSETSPTGKKRLSDLLLENLPIEQVGDEHNVVDGKVEVNGKLEVHKISHGHHPNLPNSVDGTPYLSGLNSICSSERTPNSNFKNGKEKTRKGAHCCLPSLVHSLSYNERKKQRLSPGGHTGGSDC